MEKLYGIYKGIVVFDSDINDSKNGKKPGGRVKVRIDGISISNNQPERYRQPRGSNVAGTMKNENIDLVDHHEQWAIVGLPISGENSSARYNAARDITSISDSSDQSILKNDKNHGFAPGAQFSLMSTCDGHSSGPGSIGSAGVNPHGFNYSADLKPNQVKGLMAVPSVGSKVLIQFINGNRNQPVVVGTYYSPEEYDGMYSAGDGIYPSYPNVYSNVAGPVPTV
jgi:hypothetical protein